MDTFREHLNLRTCRESRNASICDNEMLDEGLHIIFRDSISLSNLVNESKNLQFFHLRVLLDSFIFIIFGKTALSLAL